MQSQYKTIFVNPTEVGGEALIYTITVIKRAYLLRDEENSNKYD
jgi:hypothetical protein